jgi:uncharacterized LabA/DUF88 family protein
VDQEPPVKKPRVEIFVDGTNYYLALREAGIHFTVDVPRLARQLAATCGCLFVKMRYYTSPSPFPGTAAYRGQQRFFDELRKSSAVDLILGRNEPRGSKEDRYHVEKETDVNLAVDMVVGAYQNRYDTAILIGGDTDIRRAVEAAQGLGKKVVWAHFRTQQHSQQLYQLCDDHIVLDEKFLRTCEKRYPPR